jgi:hypothetical protein
VMPALKENLSMFWKSRFEVQKFFACHSS